MKENSIKLTLFISVHIDNSREIKFLSFGQIKDKNEL